MNGGLMVLLGRTLGVLGLLLCAVAAATRIGGSYFLGGFQLGTLFLAGTAAMIGGCFLLLWVLVERLRTDR